MGIDEQDFAAVRDKAKCRRQPDNSGADNGDFDRFRSSHCKSSRLTLKSSTDHVVSWFGVTVQS